MKPTSIIFLIIALVLVIGGFATAGVAKQIAAAEGIDLGVSVDKDSEPVPHTYEYGNDSIGKIRIDVKNANVNVIGGASKAYIELINFTEGMYELSPSNRVLLISDGMDITSISGLASLAMNFRGLRSFVSYYNMRELDKTVNIYICEQNPVNIVDIAIESGNVNLSNITAAADYSIDIEKGELKISGINTTSSVDVELDRGQVSIDDCYIEQMNIDIDTGDVNARAKINRLDADIDTGNFTYNYSAPLSLTNTRLFASVGSITVNGEKLGGFKETNDVATQNIIDISVSVGDIVINSGT